MRMLKPTTADWSWQRGSLSPERMTDIFEDFDRTINSFLRPTYANTVNFQPSCDVSETKEHYLISFDMPGVRKEEIKIEVHGRELLVSGERQREMNEKQGETSFRRERSYGRFERSFTLPSTITSEKIEAHYENGVLNVALPKAEEDKSRSIQVQTGQGGLLSKLLGTKKESSKDIKLS